MKSNDFAEKTFSFKKTAISVYIFIKIVVEGQSIVITYYFLDKKK